MTDDYMKKFLNMYIDDDNWKHLTELKNVIFIMLILLDLVFILIITFFKVSLDDLVFMAIFDLLICLLLFIQLCYDYTQYNKGFKSFIREHIADIIAVVPYNFIFLRYLAVFRIARLLQFFQIFKIFSLSSEKSGSFKYFVQNGLLKSLVVIVFLYLMFSSVALKEMDPAFSSVFEAFWFNLVTITSVGYGDLTPLTSQGKLIAMFSIVLGIMFVSVFTAAMSAIYMQKPEEVTRKQFKNEIHKHIGNLKQENKLLHEEILSLRKQNDELNDKVDKLIDLLDDEG